MSDAFNIGRVEPVKKVKLDGTGKSALDAYGRTLKHAVKLAPKAAPIHRGAEGVKFSKAALELLNRIGEIRNELIKNAGAPQKIVDEVLDDFLAKRGVCLKSLDKTDAKILKDIREALHSRNVIKTIIEKIKILSEKELMGLSPKPVLTYFLKK